MASRPLTITVDARVVYDLERRGIAQTAIALYRRLAEQRPDWTFIMLHRSDSARTDPFRASPNVKKLRVEMWGDKYLLWDRLRLPLANLVRRADVFHSPAGPAPSFPCAPLVSTIHDVIPLDLRPHEPDVQFWGARIASAARRAKVILTASDHARDRIIHHFGIRRERIKIVHWAPFEIDTAAVGQPCHRETIREKYGVSAIRRYSLHFGMRDPRKNTAALIRAWALVPAPLRDDCPLVIVGLDDGAMADFSALADQVGVSSSTILRGYVPDADVHSLLSNASVMCYPTVYEGFGLPILDGFRAGAAVLTGTHSSLTEVAGGAALQVDVTDPSAIAQGLTQLVGDAALRSRYVALGTARVSHFSWARTAQAVGAIFEDVASGRCA